MWVIEASIGRAGYAAIVPSCACKASAAARREQPRMSMKRRGFRKSGDAPAGFLVGSRPVIDASPLILGAGPITPGDIVRVARELVPVALAPQARARLVAGRALVERLARGDQLIYGLTTGLGAGVDTRLPADDIEAFQRRAVRARSVAVGPTLPREAVRAMMVARAAGMARGGSGVALAVFDALIAALNAGVHPVVPRRGSIGAADLALLSHMSLVLVGEGRAELGGMELDGAEALRRAGLAPVAFGPKDGHALIVANAFSAGTGALAWVDAEATLSALTIAAALSLEAFRANLSPLDPRVQAARPAPGQAAMAERLRALLAGSALWQAGAARRVQDPLSFRCVAPVHGAALAALDVARQSLDVELNSAVENPVVLEADGVMLSNGNFDVTALSLGFEMLGQALAQCATTAARRILKLMSPAMTDLPRFLTPRAQNHSGFSTVQKTVGTLEAEIRHLALPVSLNVLPAADGVEDHASMAPRVIEKTAEIVERLRYLAAIELMAAAQAIDLRPVRELGPVMRRAHDAIRARVPTLGDDRSTHPDMEALAALIASGDLARAMAS
jgi:histidine ammonia-lyase